MPIRSPVPQVVDLDIDRPGIAGPFDDAVLERSREELGEDRQHVKYHSAFSSFSPSGRSTTIRLAATSISTQMAFAKGISSWPPVRILTCSRLGPPASCHPVTCPRCS